MHALTALAVLLTQPVVPMQPPDAKLFLETRYRSIESLRALTRPLAAAFRQHIGKPAVADRGEPFNSSCVRSAGGPPERRFLAAGTSPSGSYIAYEHGGFGLHYHLVLFGSEVPQPRRLVHCTGWDVPPSEVRGRAGKWRSLVSREIQGRIARAVRKGECRESTNDF